MSHLVKTIIDAPIVYNNISLLELSAAGLVFGVLLVKKLRKKDKLRLIWKAIKGKLSFWKKKKSKISGTLIIAILLGAISFGVAIWLGLLVEFLILIGSLFLLFILYGGAAA